MNADYEMGLAQAAISNAISAATALESATYRIQRGDACGILDMADRRHMSEAIMIVERALARLRKSAEAAALEHAA